MFCQWISEYWKKTNSVPELIMFYREGLSIPQIKCQMPIFIQALKNMVQKTGVQTQMNYNPELVVLSVNTRSYTRIFEEGQSRNRSRFLPEILNPSSGTLVLDDLSSEELYDFHLISQKATEGSCSATHFIVVYDNSHMSQEWLSQFTYEQCYNYYNWTGAIKVPACLQYANKLSKLVGESIQADVTNGALVSSFYFL